MADLEIVADERAPASRPARRRRPRCKQPSGRRDPAGSGSAATCSVTSSGNGADHSPCATLNVVAMALTVRCHLASMRHCRGGSDEPKGHPRCRAGGDRRHRPCARGRRRAPHPSAKATLAGSVPAWAKAATFKSATSNTEQIGFRVYLNWRDGAGAEALAKAVSDPASPSYGRYLTPVQFRQRFSPTATDLKAVRSWLAAQGFAITYTPANRHYVAAEGSVAQANSAFGTALGTTTRSTETTCARRRRRSRSRARSPA